MQQDSPDKEHDDEIDLRELLRTLVRHKKIIIQVASVTLLAALAYALLATPVYKATATLLPPSATDIAHFVVPEVYSPDRDNLYQRLRIALESRKVYQEVFDHLHLLGHYEQEDADDITRSFLLNRFIENISLERPKIEKGTGENPLPQLFLSVNDRSADMAAKITNEIIKTANSALATEVVQDITETLLVQKKNLERDITDLREIIKKQNLDQIERIKESDQLSIKEINDQITELREIVKKQNLDQIEQIKESDQLSIEEINDQITELRATAKKKRMDEIEQLKEADDLAIQEIKEKIEALRTIASTRRADRIKILEEAAAVAKNSGIIERSSLSGANQSLEDKTAIYTEINTEQQPLYLRGEKALRAEINELMSRKADDPFIPELRDLQQQLDMLRDNKKIATLLKRQDDDPFIPELRDLQKQLELLKTNRKIEALLNRKDNDPFIPGLRDLQKQLELLKTNRKIEALLNRKDNDPFIQSLREKELKLAYLNNIQLDPAKVQLASFDQLATPPKTREKPKRSLIVVLGAIGGIFLGILAAFFVNFWQSMRLEDEANS